jgi:hypothetical protein
LICRPIAAQFIKDHCIALFAFEENNHGIGVSSEKHYHLVDPEEMTDDDLQIYRKKSF